MSLVQIPLFTPNVVIWTLSEPGNKFPLAATEADGTVLRFDVDTLKTVGPVRTMTPVESRSIIITTPAHYSEKPSGALFHQNQLQVGRSKNTGKTREHGVRRSFPVHPHRRIESLALVQQLIPRL